SASRVKPTCSPTPSPFVASMSSRRAGSTAASRTLSVLVRGGMSALQVVGDAAQHLGELGALGLVRVATATQSVGDVVEQLDDVLDDADHLVGRLAVTLTQVLGHARRGVEDGDGERLGAAASLDDPVVDARAALDGRRALGQG